MRIFISRAWTRAPKRGTHSKPGATRGFRLRAARYASMERNCSKATVRQCHESRKCASKPGIPLKFCCSIWRNDISRKEKWDGEFFRCHYTVGRAIPSERYVPGEWVLQSCGVFADGRFCRGQGAAAGKCVDNVRRRARTPRRSRNPHRLSHADRRMAAASVLDSHNPALSQFLGHAGDGTAGQHDSFPEEPRDHGRAADPCRLRRGRIFCGRSGKQNVTLMHSLSTQTHTKTEKEKS